MGTKRSSSLLFVLVIASLLLASFAGHRKLVDSHVGSEIKESRKKSENYENVFVVHPRILTVKTNDYGNYDPSPSLAKPPFKLIPN
ncbi:uncharacterized protein A4U43_C02F20360 [Asparagus officinalis]|uniref:Uncharacterized protein n=1 Tax=Asparagus officinalis TaxID=4686 RepID=A0A5P1FJP7_ASPOF|nr:uncharacterized protein LOC109829673 [Asparagus officinalis]ONK78585.1 uncharacterized protein A4U43_C02F20360 [Asparagus officinalis]